MGLNPLCHAEITFVTGVPGCPIHRLVDCRLFRMWNGFGTATCLFSKPVPPRMWRASCPFLESTAAWPRTSTKSAASVVYADVWGQDTVTFCSCMVDLLGLLLRGMFDVFGQNFSSLNLELFSQTGTLSILGQKEVWYDKKASDCRWFR